jgi:hypothetical protein
MKPADFGWILVIRWLVYKSCAQFISTRKIMFKKIIFLSILYILTISCQERTYFVKDNKVYIRGWNEGNGNYERLIADADAKTFKKMELDCDCDFLFAKDKNHLFIDGELINNIDSNTFKFVGNYIFKDKNLAYFFGFYDNLNTCAISDVDPNKIKLISYPWAKAENILIHGNDTIILDDINDFEPIDEDWGRTKSKVLNKNKILLGADPKSFKVINSYSGKDMNHEYEFGKIKE